MNRAIVKSLWPNSYSGRWISAECEKALVSVVIGSYNMAHLICEALESVLSQTYRPLEVLVVDDGSTDNTGKAIQEWCARSSRDSEFRLNYIRHEENRGLPSARNTGTLKSRGEFIVYHDSDDLMDPDRVKFQVERMCSENADLCENGWRDVSPGGHVYLPVHDSEDYLCSFLSGKIAGGSQLWMIRRDLLERAGPWDERLWCYQDIDISLRLLLGSSKAAFEPRSFVCKRLSHDGRITPRRWTTREGFNCMLAVHKKRHAIIQDLFPRSCCTFIEAQTLVHYAVLCHALGFRDIAAEFDALAKALNNRVKWGKTPFQKVFYSLGGAAFCGRIMALKRRIGRRLLTFHMRKVG